MILKINCYTVLFNNNFYSKFFYIISNKQNVIFKMQCFNQTRKILYEIFCWCNLLYLRDRLNLKDISHLEIKYKFPYCVVPYWNSIYNRGHTRLQDIFEVWYVFLMTKIWFQPIETKALYNICTSSIPQ